jgi:hypothetical protein
MHRTIYVIPQEGDAPPKAEMSGAIPCIDLGQATSVLLGNIPEPAAYLRDLAESMVALAEEIEGFKS